LALAESELAGMVHVSPAPALAPLPLADAPH
jgi:hypothetical protein